MTWIPKQSHFFFRVLTIWKCFSMRRAFACSSFLAFSSLLFFGNAVDARASVEDDVSSILDILSDGYVITIPVDDDLSFAIAEEIGHGLFQNYSTGTGGTSPYLQTILNVLRTFPTNNLTRADLLAAVSSIPSNVWSRSDITSLNTALSDILYHMPSNVLTRQDVDFINLKLDMSASSALSIDSLLSSVTSSQQNGDGVNTWLLGLDYDAEEQLRQLIQDSVGGAFDTFYGEDPEFKVTVGNWSQGSSPTFEVLSNLQYHIEPKLELIAINTASNSYWTEEIFRDSLGYDIDDSRNVKNDFRFLHQQIGVESPTSTNNVFHTLRGILAALSFDGDDSLALDDATNRLNSASHTGETNNAAVIASTETQSQNVATNEPDFESHAYTGVNPLSSLDNTFSDFSRSFQSQLPSGNVDTEKTITLFQGNMPIFQPQENSRSASLSSSPVYLDISYPLVDYDEVSRGLTTMHDLMEWVWDIFFIALTFLLYIRFFNWLRTWEIK